MTMIFTRCNEYIKKKRLCNPSFLLVGIIFWKNTGFMGKKFHKFGSRVGFETALCLWECQVNNKENKTIRKFLANLMNLIKQLFRDFQRDNSETTQYQQEFVLD